MISDMYSCLFESMKIILLAVMSKLSTLTYPATLTCGGLVLRSVIVITNATIGTKIRSLLSNLVCF